MRFNADQVRLPCWLNLSNSPAFRLSFCQSNMAFGAVWVMVRLLLVAPVILALIQAWVPGINEVPGIKPAGSASALPIKKKQTIKTWRNEFLACLRMRRLLLLPPLRTASDAGTNIFSTLLYTNLYRP